MNRVLLPLTTKTTVRLVRDAEGQRYCEGTIEDITERRTAEDALRSSEAQIRHLQKMEAIGRLAGGVAHDFNNLLTIVIGRAHLVLAKTPPPDSRRDAVTLILKTAERAAGLTKQLLAFGRKQMLSPKVFDLNASIGAMTAMLRRLIGEDIEFVLVPGAMNGHIKADPTQIEQIVVNLAVNARDAMPRGGRLTIETSNAAVTGATAGQYPDVLPGAYVAMAVRDTGTGIDPDVLPRIFEPFFTTKDAVHGSGLGLSTVYGIVRQSGGSVRVTSSVGRGATFTVLLPVVPSANGAQAADAPPPVPGGSEVILLAEDDGGVRDLVKDILETRGYTVIPANGPTAALEIAASYAGRLDMLLTDVIMPGMSGRDLAERLRDGRRDLKILYMSGYTDDAIVRHGVLVGDMPLLPKPFDDRGLLLKVRNVLDGAGAR